jgi:hypothetical protein
MAIVRKDSSLRRSPRIPVELPGALSQRHSWDVTVLDLSLTGCLLRCPIPLDTGAIVDMKADLGAQRLVTRARVVDASLDGAGLPGPTQFLVGLEFFGLLVRNASDLRQFLDHEARRLAVRDPA